MWRVGDGNLIHIWQDSWIPTPSTYYIQSPVRLLDLDAKVSALIDDATKWWNAPLNLGDFYHGGGRSNLSIPICSRQQGDCLVWAGTRNGDFFCRNAYHLTKGQLEGSGGSCSNTRIGNPSHN